MVGSAPTMQRIGILGLGQHLPATVRTNDWWPADVVAAWGARRAGGPPPGELTASAAAIVAEMRAQGADPFQGTVRRHVLSAESSILELEALAARDALARAGVAAHDIDLVLTCATPTDHQLTNS